MRREIFVKQWDKQKNVNCLMHPAFTRRVLETLKNASDVLFILPAQSWYWPCSVGSLLNWEPCAKNQVNALVKILADFASRPSPTFLSATASFTESTLLQCGHSGAEERLRVGQVFSGSHSPRLFLPLCPRYAERARFNAQLAATFLLVGFAYPFSICLG
jgi:Amt family ammonium transporter